MEDGGLADRARMSGRLNRSKRLARSGSLIGRIRLADRLDQVTQALLATLVVVSRRHAETRLGAGSLKGSGKKQTRVGWGGVGEREPPHYLPTCC